MEEYDEWRKTSEQQNLGDVGSPEVGKNFMWSSGSNANLIDLKNNEEEHNAKKRTKKIENINIAANEANVGAIGVFVTFLLFLKNILAKLPLPYVTFILAGAEAASFITGIIEIINRKATLSHKAWELLKLCFRKGPVFGVLAISIAASLGVGFAVSVAPYLPAVFTAIMLYYAAESAIDVFAIIRKNKYVNWDKMPDNDRRSVLIGAVKILAFLVLASAMAVLLASTLLAIASNPIILATIATLTFASLVASATVVLYEHFEIRKHMRNLIYAALTGKNNDLKNAIDKEIDRLSKPDQQNNQEIFNQNGEGSSHYIDNETLNNAKLIVSNKWALNLYSMEKQIAQVEFSKIENDPYEILGISEKYPMWRRKIDYFLFKRGFGNQGENTAQHTKIEQNARIEMAYRLLTNSNYIQIIDHKFKSTFNSHSNQGRRDSYVNATEATATGGKRQIKSDDSSAEEQTLKLTGYEPKLSTDEQELNSSQTCVAAFKVFQ